MCRMTAYFSVNLASSSLVFFLSSEVNDASCTGVLTSLTDLAEAFTAHVYVVGHKEPTSQDVEMEDVGIDKANVE